MEWGKFSLLGNFQVSFSHENSKVSIVVFNFSRSGINVDGKELWLPLANLVSICALLVWFPDNPDDTITRLLFPGSTPQNKVLRGLEKLKELEFMQKPVCASRSIRQPAPVAPASQTEKKEAMKAMAAAGLGGGHRIRSSSGRTVASATEKSDISSKKMSSSRSERVNVKRSTPKTSTASAASEAAAPSGPRSPKRKPEDKAQKERRNQAAGEILLPFPQSFFLAGKFKNTIFQVNKSKVQCSKERSL